MSYTSQSYSSCSSCKSYSSGSLENIVRTYKPANSSYSEHVSYSITAQPVNTRQIFYDDNPVTNPYSQSYHAKQNKSRTIIYHPVVDSFLAPGRPLTSFIGHANEIKEFIEQAFYHTAGKPFPKDLIVHVLPDKDFEKAHRNSKLDFSIQGFAINRKPFGFSEVFVRQNCMDRVMVTLGHELGHVLAPRLNNDRDEEAKAFAFCIAWLRAIKKHNIANLSTCISLNRPAQNNIHDKALEFVQSMINQGLEPLEIFEDLSKKLIGVDQNE